MVAHPRLTDEARAVLVLRASKIAVGVASVLLVAKLLVWLVSGSVALLGALADSGLDIVASGVTLLANRAAMRPADDNHRFGHGKAEALAALGQAAFIAGSAVLVAASALHGLVHPHPIQRPDLGVGVSLLAVVVTAGLVLYQRSVVQRTGSMSIAGDQLHYVGDLALNGAVAVAILVADWGWAWADPVIGLVVAAFILRGAWGLGRAAVDMLMDRELPEGARGQILALARAEPEVVAVHDLRTRRAGGQSFVQLNLELDGQLTLAEAHEIGVRVERAIVEALGVTEVLIHHEPVCLESGDAPRAGR